MDQYHWIDEEEMLDLVAIAQSSPGAIAVNGAIVVGYKLAGLPGAFVSVLGSTLPPMIILSIVSLIYDIFITNPQVAAMLRGMKAGVGAVIISVVYDMGSNLVKSKDVIQIFIMILSFILCYFCSVNIIYIILATAAFGAVRTILSERNSKNL